MTGGAKNCVSRFSHTSQDSRAVPRFQIACGTANAIFVTSFEVSFVDPSPARAAHQLAACATAVNDRGLTLQQL